MLTIGLLSITFRKLSAKRIVELASAAELDSIEWGGDIHVPHGDVETARSVKQMTQDDGLSISAYGSYYRLAEAESPAFESVLDTAEALGTALVRVWAGKRGSGKADDAYRQAVVDDARRIVDMASSRNIQVGLEYHENTLTDTLESTQQLLNDVHHNHLLTFWQPPHTPNLMAKKHGLTTLLPYLANVHVFHWNPADKARYPLAGGKSDWKDYLQILQTSNRDHALSLEFVKDDDEAQFIADAKTLKSWFDNK